MSSNDQILIRTPADSGQYLDDLDFAVYSPDIREGIVPWISNFGDLYHVRLTQQAWTAKFLESKKQLLSDMLGPMADPVVIQNIDFKLKMIAIGRRLQRWQFPSIINLNSGRLCWINGHSRLIAAGLNWNNAWDRMNYLVFVPLGEQIVPEQHNFAYMQPINSDLDLRRVLGMIAHDDQPVTMRAAFQVDNNTVRLSLQNITSTKIAVTDLHDRSECMTWQLWQTKHADRPLTVRLYCCDPDKLIDSSGIWRLDLIGPPPQDLISPAQMSMYIYKAKNQPVDCDVFTLYHFGSGHLDLAELLLQVDTEHTVFHSADWCTILVQPGFGFKCREISLS
jgi:hypothetical protein